MTAQLAAARRDDDDVAALAAALQGMREAGSDIEAFVTADVAFHLSIAQAAGNTILSDVLRNPGSRRQQSVLRRAPSRLMRRL